MAGLSVKRIAAPAAPAQKKRWGMLPGGVIRKRMDDDELPEFWAGERRERFPLALRWCEWLPTMEAGEWLFGADPAALVLTALPGLVIHVDPVGHVELVGLPGDVDTWDLFDAGLRVDPLASDEEIATTVMQATFLAFRGGLAAGIDALVGDDLHLMVDTIQSQD